MDTSDIRSTGVIGVGYQQRTVDEFVHDLAETGVSLVVDVRLTPISRRHLVATGYRSARRR